MDMTLSESCDLVGFQAKGSGNVSITAPTITLQSVQDVRQEETQTKGFSTSTNLSTGIYEALISIATQTTYQNKSTKDEVKQVTQPSGFDMGGTVALKAETFTNIGGSVQKQGTTIIAQNQLTQDLPNVHHHSEKTCIPSSLIRLALDGIPLSQSMQEFVQTLQPSTPSENFKSDLYMALDEEGVDPMVSVEILSDPEVQQVVEDVQQYTSKKQTQQLKKQEKTKSPEKLEKSVPSLTETLTSLDPSQVVKISVKTPLDTSNPVTSKVLSPDVKPSDLEGITLLNRVTTMQKKLFKKYPHLVEQIKQIGKVLEDHMDMAIDVGLNIASAYNLRGNLMKGAKFVRALQRGEKPYKAPPEQLEVQEGKPNFFGSYSEAPEFGGGTFKGFLKDEMGGGKSPFEPWMSKKQNLSVKQQKQIEGLEFYGQNPGNIGYGVHKGKPRVTIDTEFPGGLQGAREFFKQLTGEHPPLNEPVHNVKVGEQHYTFRSQGESGHPKIEVTRFDSNTNRIIMEKITFK